MARRSPCPIRFHPQQMVALLRIGHAPLPAMPCCAMMTMWCDGRHRAHRYLSGGDAGGSGLCGLGPGRILASTTCCPCYACRAQPTPAEGQTIGRDDPTQSDGRMRRIARPQLVQSVEQAKDSPGRVQALRHMMLTDAEHQSMCPICRVSSSCACRPSRPTGRRWHRPRRAVSCWKATCRRRIAGTRSPSSHPMDPVAGATDRIWPLAHIAFDRNLADEPGQAASVVRAHNRRRPGRRAQARRARAGGRVGPGRNGAGRSLWRMPSASRTTKAIITGSMAISAAMSQRGAAWIDRGRDRACRA